MDVEVYVPKKPSFLARAKQVVSDNYLKVGAVATVSGLSVLSHADSYVDVGPVTAGMQEGQGNSKIAFGGALVILVGLAIWRYTKRGVNSA